MARDLDDQGRALLDAAGEVLAREGPAALTVRRIATEAGCSTMGVYSRFGGKEGVIEQLIYDGFARLAGVLDGIGESDEPLADLRRCGRAYRRFALENASRYVVMFATVVPGYELPPEAKTFAHGTFEQLVDRVRRCQAAGLFVDEPPEYLAEVIWGTIHGHVMLELLGRSVTDRDPEQRYERALQLIQDGFRTRGARPRGDDKSGAGGI